MVCRGSVRPRPHARNLLRPGLPANSLPIFQIRLVRAELLRPSHHPDTRIISLPLPPPLPHAPPCHLRPHPRRRRHFPRGASGRDSAVSGRPGELIFNPFRVEEIRGRFCFRGLRPRLFTFVPCGDAEKDCAKKRRPGPDPDRRCRLLLVYFCTVAPASFFLKCSISTPMSPLSAPPPSPPPVTRTSGTMR